MADVHDAAACADGRNETEIERLDRNWVDLLQELRVVQTGVQLLTGLLLTLPFQQRFTELGGRQHVVYLVTLALSVASTALLIAPVSLHRALFRQHARGRMVSAAHRFALAGAGFAVFATLWGLLPWRWRVRTERAGQAR